MSNHVTSETPNSGLVPKADQRAPAADPVALRSELERILDERDLHVVYQPICDLQTGDAVGYESLARGPAGSPLELPNDLFPVATANGRLRDLDVLCQTLALVGAHNRFVAANQTLFVNIEPSVLANSVTGASLDDQPGLAQVLRDVAATCPVVLEISERDIFSQPSALFETVTWARKRGFGIAVDDVGVDPRSLALLPLVEPDVIKLDMSMLHKPPTADTGLVLNAVQAQRERTGALLLCEGIESPAHLEQARAMGADLGQGFGLGRPLPLPTELNALDQPMQHASTGLLAEVHAPFDLVDDDAPLVGTKELLLAITYDLERQATVQGDAPVLLSAFQAGYRFGPSTRRRYEAIAENAVFVGAVGTGMEEAPAHRVHGGRIPDGDRLMHEWTVLVLSPHFAGGLLAYDLGDEGPEATRRFKYAITHDREQVAVAARALMRRISS